jgi:hypothetical protein
MTGMRLSNAQVRMLMKSDHKRQEIFIKNAKKILGNKK